MKGSCATQVTYEGSNIWTCNVQEGVSMSMNREHGMCEIHTRGA